MALRPRPEPVPTDEQQIQPLDQHPEYRRLATLHRAIRAALDDRQRRIDLLSIEAELARLGRPASGQRIALLREHAERLRLVTPEPKPEAPTPEGLSPTIARALLLVRGDAVAEPEDRESTAKRLRNEQRTLDAALREIDQMLDAVRAEQSRIVAEQVLPQHRAILRSVFDAAAALAAAVEAERRMYANILTMGYEGRPDILRRPALDGASRLGTLAEYESDISRFRRRLQEQGILA
jgi:hypothetical protein